ncbi:MAG: shikimate kinase [candidate division Zixibacteria bacterium]|nr:shikimate kinase [candidate division Zixibacteria bacterium]
MAYTGTVFIIGFSGSGKSTIGRRLARRLKANFFDTDAIIEQKEGRQISEIFTDEGERYFRRLEKAVILGLLEKRLYNKVIALGGGAFEMVAIRNEVQNTGPVIYLRCSQRELYRRLKDKNDRPLLLRPSGQDLRDRIRELVSRREKNYTKADIVLSTTRRSIEQTVRELVLRIRKQYGND